MITGLCKADVATDGPHVASDCHVVVLCLQWGRPVQSKCIVHTSLYYTAAAVHSRECDRLFKFDKFLVSETHLSSCVSVRIRPREGSQSGAGGGGFFHVSHCSVAKQSGAEPIPQFTFENYTGFGNGPWAPPGSQWHRNKVTSLTGY